MQTQKHSIAACGVNTCSEFAACWPNFIFVFLLFTKKAIAMDALDFRELSIPPSASWWLLLFIRKTEHNRYLCI